MAMNMKTAVVKVITDETGFTLEKSRTELALLKAQSEMMTNAVKVMRAGLTAGGLSVAGLVMPSFLAAGAVGTFQQELRLAAEISDDPAFGQSMDDITNRVKSLAIQYGVASDTIAEGVKEFSKIGYGYAEITDQLLIPTVQLASANLMSMSEAVTTTNKMWNIFGKEGGYDAYTMLNTLHYAANLSALSVENLSTIVKNTAPTYAIANISMEEWIATAAALSMHGVEMSARQGTFASQMMSNQDKFMKVMKNNQIIVDGQVNWTQFMEDLSKMDTASQQYSDLVNLFGAGRSGRSIHELKASADMYAEMLAKIRNANDSLSDQANAMAGTIPALFKRIKEVMYAPLKSQTMMDKLIEALEIIQDALVSESFTLVLYNLIELSTMFVTGSGAQLIRIFSNLLGVLIDLAPMMNIMADVFSAFAEMVSFGGKHLFTFLIGVSVLNRHFLPFIASVRGFGGALMAHNAALTASANRQREYTHAMREGITYTELLTTATDKNAIHDLNVAAKKLRKHDEMNAAQTKTTLINYEAIAALRLETLAQEEASLAKEVARVKEGHLAEVKTFMVEAELKNTASIKQSTSAIVENTVVRYNNERAQLQQNRNKEYAIALEDRNRILTEFKNAKIKEETDLININRMAKANGLAQDQVKYMSIVKEIDARQKIYYAIQRENAMRLDAGLKMKALMAIDAEQAAFTDALADKSILKTTKQVNAHNKLFNTIVKYTSALDLKAQKELQDSMLMEKKTIATDLYEKQLLELGALEIKHSETISALKMKQKLKEDELTASIMKNEPAVEANQKVILKWIPINTAFGASLNAQIVQYGRLHGIINTVTKAMIVQQIVSMALFWAFFSWISATDTATKNLSAWVTGIMVAITAMRLLQSEFATVTMTAILAKFGIDKATHSLLMFKAVASIGVALAAIGAMMVIGDMFLENRAIREEELSKSIDTKYLDGYKGAGDTTQNTNNTQITQNFYDSSPNSEVTYSQNGGGF